MDKFNVRYVWEKDGETQVIDLTLEQIETCDVKKEIKTEGWTLKARHKSTGLKDKSSKLSYDGDLINGISYKNGTKRYYKNAEITYNKGCYWVEDINGYNAPLHELLPPNKVSQAYFKVVGNIHKWSQISSGEIK